MPSDNQVYGEGVSSVRDITVPVEVHSVTNERQHAPLPSFTSANQTTVKRKQYCSC